MGKLRWYKRDPAAALAGFMELDLEERGAYGTVLDLIYDRDGDLPDDDRFIAGWCRVDVRVWKRIKAKLIERGKLYVADGKVRNKRADVEVVAALSRVASAAEAGVASGISRRGKSPSDPNENKDLGRTDVPTEPERNPELTTTTVREDKGDSPLKPPRAKRAAETGTYIPDDWMPTDDDRQYARSKGFADAEIDSIAEEFRLYWSEASGQRARKRDWSACWKRRVLELPNIGRGPSRRSGGNGGGGGGDRRADSRQAGRLADSLAVLHRRGSLEGLGLH